jgi:OOP family OmpA-OmpF porin
MKTFFLFLCCLIISVAQAQQIEWAANVNYDNEFSLKDGYRARLVIGPPNAEKYGSYSKGAGTLNANKTASIWLDYLGLTVTKQILILESHGAGNILKVDLVDAITGTTTPVYEKPVSVVNTNYRLTRIVLPDMSLKAKMLKIKFSASSEKQQVDAVGITASSEEFTLESLLLKFATTMPQFNTAGNDVSLNNITFNFNPSNINVLSVKKEIGIMGMGLKPGESGNLGYNVNSEYDELQPLITPDGQTLFYVRDGHPQNTYGNSGSQDIWYALLNKEKVWDKAVKMPPPFNEQKFNGIQNITPDGNTILVRGSYEKNVLKGKGFSFYRRTLNGWSNPEKLNIKHYEKMCNGTYNGAYLSNDGRTLLMYFNEIDNEINSNLYVSFLADNNTWSKPKSLGPGINTNADESTMFLASDGVTMYFSSDRQGGLGKNDIYMAKRLDTTWTNWSPPVNLGPTVNTSSFDAYYSVPASGDYAYMVSGRNSLGGSDIVRFKLREEIKPNPVVLISGKVIHAKTKMPVDAAIVYQVLPDGKEAGMAHSAPSNGEYKIVLPYGTNYGFNARAPGFLAISDNIDLTTISAYAEITRDLYLVPMEVGEIVRMNNIFFDFGKSTLNPESFPELDRVLTYLTDNPTMEINIGGHTDNVGTSEDNISLSSERANAVKEYLVEKGIQGIRIQSKGYGESQPLEDNATEAGKKINRRVEFTILKK